MRISAVALLAAFAAGGNLSCTFDLFDFGFGGGGTTQILYMDQMNASVIVVQKIGETTATILAKITNSLNQTVTFKNGQAVAVGGTNLAGPDENGIYYATVGANTDYVIVVTEPTSFVVEDSVAAPGTFEITAPAPGATASLAGFTVTWSNPDPDLEVEVVLKQIVNGSEKQKALATVADTGTQTLTYTDLKGFVHGKNETLSVTVTKIRKKDTLQGFKTGTASARLSTSVSVVTGP